MKLALTAAAFLALLILGANDYFTDKRLGYDVCSAHVEACE